jgi:23S rRNA pseudouridine1911/1915/1917 synthase
MPTFQFDVPEAADGQRLDIFLRDRDEPDESRSQIKKRIDRGEVAIDGETAGKAGERVRTGETVVWEYEPPTEPDLEPEDIPLDFLYDDQHLAVVDKPAGLVVHPAPGHPDGTLVNALLYHLDDLAGVGGELRPGIVHRLDKETSGAMVVTKNDETHRALADQFKEHTVGRRYHALVFGPGLDDEGTFETGHRRDPSNRMRYTGQKGGDRRAITHYEVVERFDSGVCLVECWLETGRTHQIRMHFYEANAPVLSDSMYAGRSTGNSRLLDRQALHARTLAFEHPSRGERMDFESPYPEDFAYALEELRRGADWRG